MGSGQRAAAPASFQLCSARLKHGCETVRVAACLLTPAKFAKSPRILIVDDDAGQRSLLNSFLKSTGLRHGADSGERALETLRGGEFQMMISDVRMGISGLETLRRARELNATLPVLLVTAYTDIRDAVGRCAMAR